MEWVGLEEDGGRGHMGSRRTIGGFTEGGPKEGQRWLDHRSGMNGLIIIR